MGCGCGAIASFIQCQREREHHMAPEIGYFALLLALFVSVVQSATLFVAAHRRDPTVAAFADQAALARIMHHARRFRTCFAEARATAPTI